MRGRRRAEVSERPAGGGSELAGPEPRRLRCSVMRKLIILAVLVGLGAFAAKKLKAS
ncbi:hypothetical protein K6U06_23940 [Acidiferrimicrobium sp. IK]|uniref:hypothetical protein n=1 Tax=Acidiferrimicrobium sp. IK TaxID=2871700 RepID=UPI0021CB0D15|nr:hypothetical protein [Acidiferrimicrobium sp. IK]MCU4187431.1 hypothetical protein [Acidiferrimicrobium sp. IK]